MTQREYALYRLAAAILSWEARYENGHLAVYKLPDDDGGGDYEVAGVCNKYHEVEAAILKAMVENGRYEDAKEYAKKFILQYSGMGVTNWDIENIAVECFLRDCAYNRGPGGAAIILQKALGVTVDGHVGPKTQYALREKEADAQNLIEDLVTAREWYERKYCNRNESSRMWAGLKNRWAKCLDFCTGVQKYINSLKQEDLRSDA